jgi:hypothetical protein
VVERPAENARMLTLMDVVYGVLDGVRVVRAWETVTA